MSALLKRLRKEVALIPSNEENWELFGAERIWANLMGNREGICAKDQQTIREACTQSNLFTASQTEFLDKLSLETLNAMVRIAYQADAHHVIRQRTDRIKGAIDLLEQTKMATDNKAILVAALREFLNVNKLSTPLALATNVRLPLSSSKLSSGSVIVSGSTARGETENTPPLQANDTGLKGRPPRFNEVMKMNCEMDRTLTIIDLTFIIFASYYAPQREATDEERLAIFLKMFNAIIFGLNPKNLLICLDSPAPLQKMTKIDSYKGTRRFDSRMSSHFDQVGDFLIKCKVKTIRMDGFEADDLINAAVKHWLAQRSVNQAVIITSDKDFFQICSERVWIYKYQKEHRRYQLYRPAEVLSEYGIRPDQFVDYQCLVGDDSDAIPGLDGVGKKTAIAMLQQHGTVLRVFQHAAAIGDSVLLSQYKRVCEDNKYLLTFLQPQLSLRDSIESLRFDANQFGSWFSKYLNTHLPQMVRTEFARRSTPAVVKLDDSFE